LALLYGARELRGDPYFSHPIDPDSCPGQFNTKGLIDSNENTTANYDFFRYTIIPRLNGWFGKTLKKIHQTYQYPKVELPVQYASIQYLYYIDYDGNSPAPRYIDVGFFTKGDEDYFMILSRWYCGGGDSLIIGIDKSNQGYNNWNITNFIDSTTKTIIEQGYVKMLHKGGDARLFKVYPVVIDGGSLVANDTISGSTTLMNDMTIESGVTLTVNGTYNCYADIYLKGTGRINTVDGGTINFYNGKGIIAEGYPQILGTSSHSLTIDFGSITSGTGIRLLNGAQTFINYCTLKNSVNLISSDGSQFKTTITACEFQNTSSYAISLSGSATLVPSITGCSFINTDNGIFAAGQSSITISDNLFEVNQLAISLSQIPNIQIFNNYINSNTGSLPGISLISCGGNIRSNLIIGHSIGLLLANSSPLVGNNEIYGNKINGIYVGPGSVPDLRAALVGHPPDQYVISGYNEIMINGGYNASGGGYPSDDGSEIYFSQSNIQLDHGCNLISDDRTPIPRVLTTLYLMNGSITSDTLTGDTLYAAYNAWGDTVYAERFGRLTVVFSPYYNDRCDMPGSGSPLVLQDNDGNTLDTVYSMGSPAYTLTNTDIQYAQAAEYMINRDYTSADAIYNSIITAAPGDTTSEAAYLGLYKSARLQNLDSTGMAELRDLFNTNLETMTDSLMIKIVSQLSLLTLVDERQYSNAINGFGDIINQNPESEEAMFAEIDAMTTSLLAKNGNDSTLNKGPNKKLLVKGPLDMQNRLNALIKSRFGIQEKTEGKEIIPTEYLLYNNYPNPFNPTTTIRFDIPERTEVELIVFDILGRKVKTLISSEVRNPGRYEVSFNASSLASGVYIYRLTTKNYSQARKMLLVK
jgi:hypothetical protein